MPARAPRIDDVASAPAATGHSESDGAAAHARRAGDCIALAHVDPARVGTAAFFSRSRAAAAVKRAVDLIAATVLLILTAPLSFLVAAWIKLHDGGPVLFRQARVGRHGAVFVLRKFRSCGSIPRPTGTGVGAGRRSARHRRRPLDAPARHRRDPGSGMSCAARYRSSDRGRSVRSSCARSKRRFRTIATGTRAARHHRLGAGQLPYGATVEDARRKLEYDLYYLEHACVRMDLAIMLRTGRQTLSGWRSR
jgi:hypothetical protein